MIKVYVLSLKNNKFYLGTSHNVKKRFNELKSNINTIEFLKLYPPIKIVEIIDHESLEEATLRYFSLYEVDNVRSDVYNEIIIETNHKRQIEEDYIIRHQLCLRCMKSGHFVENCNEKKDAYENKLFCKHCGVKFFTKEELWIHHCRKQKRCCILF